MERPYWRDGRFWIIVFVIVALYAARLSLTEVVRRSTISAEPELTTLALFLIPLLYVALNISTRGAVSGSIFLALISIPRAVAYYQEQSFVGVWAQVIEIAVLIAIVALVGNGVDRERQLRKRAESARAAHLEAEARYHELFDSNASPILIVDASGATVDLNQAARALVADRSRVRSAGIPLPEEAPAPGSAAQAASLAGAFVELVGRDVAGALLGSVQAAGRRDPRDGSSPYFVGRRDTDLVEIGLGTGVHLFRPVATYVQDQWSSGFVQVVLEDVTADASRRQSAEAYAVRLMTAQEEERKRLAQELHDGPLQSLIHLCRQVDVASAAMAVTDGEVDRNALEQVRDVAESVVGELRSIARGLRPSILDDLGLQAAIRRILTDMESRAPVVTEMVSSNIDSRLSPYMESALYRIAQEALSNVERHSGAGHARVELERIRNWVHLRVQDDGCGFDLTSHDVPSDSSTSAGRPTTLGLLGMKERANLLGGIFHLQSLRGQGTFLEVSVPVLPGGSPLDEESGGPDLGKGTATGTAVPGPATVARDDVIDVHAPLSGEGECQYRRVVAHGDAAHSEAE